MNELVIPDELKPLVEQLRKLDLGGTFILDGNNQPVPVTVIEKALWSDQNPDSWRVAKTILTNDLHETVEISTVFLGLDLNHYRITDPDAPPLVFETMIFGGRYDMRQWRHFTYDQAKSAHEKIVAALKLGYDPEMILGLDK